VKKFTALFLSALIVSMAFLACGGRGDAIVVASKNYTEQFILGYVLQILIEENTPHNTRLVSNLPSLMIFQGIRTGEIDLYIEYTGTVVQAFFGIADRMGSEEVFQTARTGLQERYDIRMLDRIGFNNTYTLSVRQDTAEQFGLRTISDLARVSDQLTLGATFEFMNRPDGLPGMKDFYHGMSFRNEVAIEGVLRYTALMNDEVQVIDAFSTEGMLRRHNLVVLEDDLEFFPAYHAAVIIREDTAARFPDLIPLLNRLIGTLDEYSMSALNYRVDGLHESPQHVARTFLRDAGLIP